MKLPRHGRYEHSAIRDRATYDWPNGARLALTVVNNIEHFAYRAGLGTDSAQPGAPQNQRNYAWRDYGNRVGLWYLLDLLDELEVPSAHNVNATVLDACPEIVPALMARGDEFIAHGRTNSERQDVMWEDDERRLIAESRDSIIRHTGTAPKGWLGTLYLPDFCQPGSVETGRLQLHAGVAGGRPAVLDEDVARPHPVGALFDRAQRQSCAGFPPA